MIEDQLADEIIGTIRKLAKSFKMKTYNEDTGYGLLRHVLVKRGFATGQVMVVIVTGTHVFPSRNNFVKALVKAHPEITTIIHNINERRTSMVLGDREKVMYGKGYIEDILCGKKFRISANVIGVELNKDAVRDAIGNAKGNKVSNIRFVAGDAGQFMTGMAAEAKHDKSVRLPDVVLMDPPRAGSDKAFLSSMVKMGPEKVVYISCNPETLARDVKWLEQNGYKAQGAWPVDMFPHTSHCEVVSLLVKAE